MDSYRFFRILFKKIKMDLPAGEVGIENERPDCVTSASCVCVYSNNTQQHHHQLQ